jgi:membrane protease YdiL (CAAX protease family)
MALAILQPRAPGAVRLAAWLLLVLVVAGMNFGTRAMVANTRASAQPQGPTIGFALCPDGSMQPMQSMDNPTANCASGGSAIRANDGFYSFSFGVFGLIAYGILLGFVLLIARGLPGRETFALYRPKSWRRIVGLVLGALLATYVLLAVTSAALGPGAHPDQGVPTWWDGSRVAQFALSFVVVAVAAPIVEELTFRGLGYSLLSPFGSGIAIAATGVLFGLMHGFVVALPIFVIVGLVLGWVRMRSGSVYPGMLMHGAFNAIALILAVSVT